MVELVWLRRSLNAALRAPSIGVMNGDKLTFPCPHCATLNRAPVARLAAPAEEQSFLETLRRLWRHRLLIATTTLVERTRRTVLDWFHASPDEYTAIFTANATGALKHVGE